MLNLNPTTLAAVVEKATHDAVDHPRWLQAIARAIVELDSNPWIERGDMHGLIIASPSGNLYTANGTCQCPAHTYGNACWHRAAARIVRLHDEALERQQQPAALAREIKAMFAEMDERESQAEDRLIAQLETAVPSFADRLARARAATAAMNELFA